jgi:hypothetical protein
MSGQAYLDSIEKKTGLTPRELVERAHTAGLGPATKTGEVVAWFKSEYELGHGHAMAMAQTIKHYESVDIRNKDTTSEPPGSIGRMWLDGAATRPW